MIIYIDRRLIIPFVAVVIKYNIIIMIKKKEEEGEGGTTIEMVDY